MKKSFLRFGMALALGSTAILGAGCSSDDDSTDPVVCDTCSTPPVSNIVTVSSSSDGVGTTTWTKNNIYLLDGFVFVNDGQILTIEAGTIIKGKFGAGAEASALIVAQGGKIMAEGTPDMPIIFTGEYDVISRDENGLLTESNLDETSVGQWGGLIVLGKAGITDGQVANIEGIPTSETRGIYGGSENADNSGVLKYISIRHGGTNIGADNEINGLTLGGVGSATTIDYVEVFANQDDGIEWFGGTANVKHAVVSHCGDDSFDYDEGWRGKTQFMLTVQNSESDRGGEHDGGPSSCETCEPYAIPEFRNVTYIAAAESESRALTFRDNAGGKYINAIFSGFKKGIDIEDLADGGDSKQQLEDGNLMLDNISLDGVSGNYVTFLDYGDKDADGKPATVDAIDQKNVSNITTDASTGVSATNPVGTVQAGASLPADDFFEAASYRGAFSGTNWAQGWTKLYQ